MKPAIDQRAGRETVIVTTPTDREIVITRKFDAPRRLVFRTLTEPDLVKRWLYGPEGWSFVVCDIDLRAGGGFRYVWQNGTREMGLRGAYREIVAPERIVHTERFDGDYEGGGSLVTVALAEREAYTILTMTVLYESPEARDEAIESGMTSGLDASFDRVDALLLELAAQERHSTQ